MIHCALISSDDTFRRLIRGLTQHPEAEGQLAVDIPQSAAEVSRETLAQVLGRQPQVVFVDLGETLTGIRVIQALSQEAPDMVLVAAGPQLPADSLLAVIRAGATEYLPLPTSSEEVSAAFARVRRRVSTHVVDHHVSPGRVFTFFSAKGGTGVTTLATNVALALQEITGEETLLVDLSPLGTAALHLGLQPRYCYLDVIQNFHRIDEELLRSFLEVHESGVALLASAPLAQEEIVPTVDQVVGLLRLCRRHFPHVVIDAGNHLTDVAFGALVESDERLLVATADLPTLRNLRRVLDLFQRHNGKAPPSIVLNRFDRDAGLTLKDVERALHHKVRYAVDDDGPVVSEAVNLGRPAVQNRRSRFAKDVLELGSALAGPGLQAVERSGFLDSLLRSFRRETPSGKETS